MSDYSREIQAFMAANYIFEYDFIALAGILSSGGGKRNSPHQLYRQRSEEGALNVLIERHLMDDDTKFREYFRVTPFLFFKLLDEIKPDLETTATTWIRNPITPKQKLCVTLRYLATGESFRSLAFQFRIHHSTIGRIINVCLESIISRLLTKAIPTPSKTSFQQVIFLKTF